MTPPLAARFKLVVQKRLGLALGVWGEAGVGKSYQVRELLQTLPCKNLSLHATTPLATLAQALPKARKLPFWAESNLKRLAGGEAIETSSTLDSLGAALAGLAPFVLHFEDVHEADQERLAFLQELAKLIVRIKGVALVVTSRREPPEPFTALKLEPLSKEEADTLLERELKNPLPSEASKWIYDKAAGNPLYSLEYLRYLTRQGFLWNDGKSWHWRKPPHDAMPVTVEALIEHLLNQAKREPLQRYVLETKAFLPLDSSDEVWQQVARVNEQELRTATTELTQQGIFKDNNFAHPLFREVTLKTLSLDRKRNLARRAINVLANEPQAAAMFVEEAGLKPSQALELLKKASEDVKERSEVEAARLLAKAVAFAEGEEKGTLALEAATVLKNYDLQQALYLAEIALAHFPGKTEVTEVLITIFTSLKERDKAEYHISLLSEEEKQGEKGLHRWLELYELFHDDQATLDLLEKHPGLLESNTPSILITIIYAMIYTGQVEKAKGLIQRGLSLPNLKPSGYARFHYVQGIVFAQFDTNNCEAEGEFRLALAGFREANITTSIIAALHAHAMVLQDMGNYQDALHDLEEAAELSLRFGNISVFAETNIAIADQLRWCGNYERAEELYVSSLDILRRHDDPAFLFDCLNNLAALYCDWRTAHSATLAVKYGQEALNLAKSRNDVRQLVSASCDLATAMVLAGNPSRALELATQATELAQTPAQILNACASKAAATEALGQHEEALKLWLTAKHLAEEIGRPYNLHLVSLELDRLNNDVESARKRVQWFEERGLLNGVNIAKRYFPELAGKPAQTVNVHHAPRLEVLGGMQLSQEGKTEKVRGTKRQEFLALLLEARLSGRTEVGRLELFDSLYPEDDERKAAHALKVLVHDVRQGVGANTLTTTANGYALGSCTSDAEEFLQTLETSLWRGTYLEGLELANESNVRDALYTALFEKAQTLLELEPQEAARVGSILTQAEPYEKDYLKLYLTALRLSKNHGKLTRHYQEARERLLEVNEALPETWQNFLG